MTTSESLTSGFCLLNCDFRRPTSACSSPCHLSRRFNQFRALRAAQSRPEGLNLREIGFLHGGGGYLFCFRFLFQGGAFFGGVGDALQLGLALLAGLDFYPVSRLAAGGRQREQREAAQHRDGGFDSLKFHASTFHLGPKIQGIKTGSSAAPAEVWRPVCW